MRYLLFAVLFACTIAIASSNTIINHRFPFVQAQDQDPPIRVWKTVQDSIPDSDWEYVWSATEKYGGGYSGEFTIDKAGGGKTLNFQTSFTVVISEKMKSGYAVSIAYGSMSESVIYGGTPETTLGTSTVKMTSNLITGNVVTIPALKPPLTYFVDFYNSYTPQQKAGYHDPSYVGGEISTGKKMGILAPYLALTGLIATLSALYLMKRHKT